MAVTFTTRDLGGLRTSIVHGPSGTVIETDAPTDNHGQGMRFSPTDLAASSLGSCMLTTMDIASQREGFSLEGATALIEKHMTTELPRKIAKIVVTLTMPPGITDEQRSRLERIARNCPVALSLNNDIDQVITFTWPD